MLSKYYACLSDDRIILVIFYFLTMKFHYFVKGVISVHWNAYVWKKNYVDHYCMTPLPVKTVLISFGRSLTACRGGGASFRGGLLLGGSLSQGRSSTGGWYPSMHWGRPPPVNRITDACKNITLATTSLRPVITVQYAY